MQFAALKFYKLKNKMVNRDREIPEKPHSYIK